MMRGMPTAVGVEKPSPEFFEKVRSEAGCPPGEIAYVGDRLDDDVLPARRAGMWAVFVRRGPWGHVHARRPEVSEADARDRRAQKRLISWAGAMTMTGAAAGSSQRSTWSSSPRGRLTHPSVGLPVSAWRKMAEPS